MSKTENELDIETALAFLQKTQSKGNTSVLDHLTDVVAKILDDQPKDAVDLLETSYLIKRLSDSGQEEQTIEISAAEDEEYAKRAAIELEALSVKEPVIDPETGEAEEVSPPNEYECEDVLGNGALFEALGVGLTQEELYEVVLMSRILGEDPQLSVSSIRFFGKFYGLEKDYFVFETTLKTPPEAIEANLEGAIPVEAGIGANAHVYFTCQEVGEGFTRLPDTTPTHIKSSRSLRRFLTGSLHSDVSAFPLFHGNEAHYLRAIIARIAATTMLCPIGVFTINEEGELEKQEEPSFPSQEDLVSLSNWCHWYPHLKKQGRCTIYTPEAEEDGEGEVELTEEEAEKGPSLLTTIENDAMLEWSRPWTVISSSANPQIKHQVIGVRSNLWTGAFSAVKGTRFANVYVGWGLKEGPFNPQTPPPLSREINLEELRESNALPPKPEKTQDETTEQEAE